MKSKPTVTVIGHQGNNQFIDKLTTNQREFSFSLETKASGSHGVTFLEHRDWLIVLIHGTSEGITRPDLDAAGRWIARSRAILLLLDVSVGLVRRVTRLAPKRAKILVDPVPALDISEKIRRMIREVPLTQGHFRKQSLRSCKNRKFKR
jgi:hypothetical protein